MHIRHHEEINKMWMIHDDELEQHQDHIDKLEEEVLYKQAIIDFLTDNIMWLEEDTNWQRMDINRLIEQSIEDRTAWRESVAVLKYTIIALFDNVDLDSHTQAIISNVDM